MFSGKVAIVTGGAQGIGKAIVKMFRDEGATIYIIDQRSNDDFVGDISDKSVLDDFIKQVISKFGKVDYLINNAMLSKGGIQNCSYDDFDYVLRTGITAPYYLSKSLMPYFNDGACIINMTSTRYLMSQANTESYTAAKGGITALTHGLAISLAGKVRVNGIAPGWIDNTEGVFSDADHKQQPVGRIGKPEDIAKAVKFLCSEDSSYITGEILHVDGGMTKQMIYHGEAGWHFTV